MQFSTVVLTLLPFISIGLAQQRSLIKASLAPADGTLGDDLLDFVNNLCSDACNEYGTDIETESDSDWEQSFCDFCKAANLPTAPVSGPSNATMTSSPTASSSIAVLTVTEYVSTNTDAPLAVRDSPLGRFHLASRAAQDDASMSTSTTTVFQASNTADLSTSYIPAMTSVPTSLPVLVSTTTMVSTATAPTSMVTGTVTTISTATQVTQYDAKDTPVLTTAFTWPAVFSTNVAYTVTFEQGGEETGTAQANSAASSTIKLASLGLVAAFWGLVMA